MFRIPGVIGSLALMLLLGLVVAHQPARPDGGPALAAPLPAAAPKNVASPYVPGSILVKRRASAAVAAVEAATGARLEAKLRDRVERYRVPAGREGEQLARLRRSHLVEYAELEYVRQATGDPNDPLYPQQWALSKIGATAAWGTTTGSASIVIAVVDSGVLATHQDLAGKVLLEGRNFTGIGNPADATDDFGHGTHVAGIAAAVTNNGVGMAGVNWGARILPVKVLNSAGGGSDGLVAQGIYWAADQGAQIINLSLGGPGYSQTLADAVAYAQSKGSLVVAAMGNEGAGTSGGRANPVYYPAAYPKVVAVGATTSADTRAAFSDYGDHMWVGAPGLGILSTVPKSGPVSDLSGYKVLNGTSMATPHVSGLAALIWSAHPEFNADIVRRVIQQSASDLAAAGWDQHTGWGRIDASRAVQVPGTSTAIKGRVINDFGNPLPGVTVSTGPSQTTTDANGLYTLFLPPVDAVYDVTASHPTAAVLPPRRAVPVEAGTWTAADFLLPQWSNLLYNGGFERGGLDGWTVTTVFTPTYSPRPGIGGPGPSITSTARSGSFAVHLGFDEDLDASGTTDYTSDVRLAQQLTVPVSATLSFWYRFRTVDLTPSAPCSFDCLTVTVKSLAGQALLTVLQTNQGSGWKPVTADLSALAGQTVVVEIRLYNDANQTTSVLLDEIAVSATLPIRRTYLPLVVRQAKGP